MPMMPSATAKALREFFFFFAMILCLPFIERTGHLLEVPRDASRGFQPPTVSV